MKARISGAESKTWVGRELPILFCLVWVVLSSMREPAPNIALEPTIYVKDQVES